ncbi:unnamed protein product [Phytomonas sp. Hart1]|nr:unnamed protein product [Phytomonas sp. Hart1]|eukprot:CCW72353.1 unnamed protein product [Phytomonas sp. isolate Hart1]
MSLVALEVNLIIIPGCIIFLLFFLPVAFVSKTVSQLLQIIEKPSFSKLTFLSVIAIATFIAFLSDVAKWHSVYGSKPKPVFPDISIALQHDNKRLRLERNIYIHVLSSVLSLSIKKLSTIDFRKPIIFEKVKRE